MRLSVPLIVLLAWGLHGCAGGSTPAAISSPPAPVDAIEDDFSADATATHYHPIHRAAFGLVYGSGCPEWGKCGCGDAKTLAQEFNCQVEQLARNDIPISAYLFDGNAWSHANSGSDNVCVGADCCSWKLGDQVVDRLAGGGIRGLLHFWGGCHSDDQYRRAYDKLGRNLLGFYLDDGSSDEELQQVSEYMQSANPGDWECVAKAYQNREPSTSDAGLSKWANAAYVGDLPLDFDGLAQGVSRVLAMGRHVPAPYNELTGYAYQDDSAPDEEVFYRRLHFGALQPVMAHTPYANSDPWRPEYGRGLLDAYRYYTWLHRELVPYFYSYAYRMFETNRRVVWPGPTASSIRIGRELFVPVVTQPTRAMDIELPSGSWIDYWDESEVASGVLRAFPVPPGREPIFIRLGAIIPMQVERPYTGHGTRESKGSLTVLVYPDATSSLRYREDPQTAWITFTSVLSGDKLTLTAAPALPQSPVIYRIGRWSAEPQAVAIDGARVLVNDGGSLARASSEADANGSRSSTWFYDGVARRLIVKVAP